MAFLKAIKTDPNARYAPPQDMLEVAAALTAALDERERVDAAIATNAADRKAADEARKHAEAEVERVDLELALEFDITKTEALERQLTAARMRAQSAATAFERATKRQNALYGLAPEKDAAVAVAKENFHTHLALHGRTVNEALADEIRHAAQQLVQVLRRGHAVAVSLGTLSQVRGLLDETMIPSPAPGQQPIIANGKADAADGTRIDLAAEWRADPAAADLAKTMEPLTNLRRRAASFKPFTPPPPCQKPYEVSPANRRTAEELAAERAAAEAWKPPASTWTPHSNVPRSGVTNAGANEISSIAGTANAATALAGGAQ